MRECTITGVALQSHSGSLLRDFIEIQKCNSHYSSGAITKAATLAKFIYNKVLPARAQCPVNHTPTIAIWLQKSLSNFG